jgi:predicted enzyme related to lactoylglutathione lyase
MSTRHAVTGLGGIFWRAKNAPALRDWYREHLGIPIEAWGGTSFVWRGPHNPEGTGQTVWSLFDAEEGKPPFTLNYRVADLHAMLAQLRADGCTVEDKIEDSEYGKFGWVIDPEGHRVELWQPPAGQ